MTTTQSIWLRVVTMNEQPTIVRYIFFVMPLVGVRVYDKQYTIHWAAAAIVVAAATFVQSLSTKTPSVCSVRTNTLVEQAHSANIVYERPAECESTWWRRTLSMPIKWEHIARCVVVCVNRTIFFLSTFYIQMYWLLAWSYSHSLHIEIGYELLRIVCYVSVSVRDDFAWCACHPASVYANAVV